MKKIVYLSSLPALFALAYVLSPKAPAPKGVSAALDLQDYIGEVEYGVTEEAALESSAVDSGASDFSFNPSAPALLQRALSFTRIKVFQLFSIPMADQPAPRLAHPVPVGFMLWFAHLGWYP